MMFRRLGLVVALLGASSCGSSSGGGGGPQATASGVAVKGPVAGASVTIHELRPTGTLGEIVGSGSSNASGEFEVGVDDHVGWAVARVSEGAYVDEATGATVSILPDEALYGFVEVQESSVDFAITPLTTIAVALMQSYAHDPEATVADSVENALTATENLFGLVEIDIRIPADLTAGAVVPGPEADSAAVIAGLSKLAETESVGTLELIGALARDASDGRLDGTDHGGPVPLGAGALAPTAGTLDLSAAIAAFLASPRNASGLTDADTLVDDELAASSGDFDWPIQVRALVNGFGDVNAPVAAELEAALVPPSPQVLIETQLLTITNQTATELGFEIPVGLALGRHDLVVRDQDTGLVTRLRDAVEVSDYTSVPIVNEIAPPAGPLTGGTFLRLSGRNFGPDTEVEVDGTLVERLAADFPRWMVVATPAHAAGAVSVTVRNGSAELSVPNAFEYRSGDTRANPALPAPTAPIVFGAFRHFADAAAGVTAQALLGRSAFTSFDSGSFNLIDFTSTQLAPAIATRQREGSTFQSNESLAKAFLLFDADNGISDFLRGFTSEENGVSLGATAFGPACFFPEPTEMQLDTLADSYWINGLEVNVGLSTVRQKTGWMELDESSRGSASLLAHGRDFGGAAFDLGAEKWELTFTLSLQGRFQGTRTIDESSESLLGHFSAGADLGFLTMNGSDGTLGYYLLTPIAHGVESAAWGGWVGGYLRQGIADDGLGGEESTFESGTSRALVGGTAAQAAQLAFRRSTRVTEGQTTSSFSEYVGAVELDVSPSGRLFLGNTLAGFVNPCGGILLPTGTFPDECLLNGGVELPLALGGAVFRDSRKSFLSLEPSQKQIAIEAKFLESGTTRQQELGTELFDLVLDPDTQPSVTGVVIPQAGTIPALEAATLAGVHKSTVRDSLGAVVTTRGAPPAWGVQVGYSFVDDTLDLYATEVTEPLGRFGGASMPRWVASGVLGNDGEVAALRGNDEVLGDGLFFLVSNRAVELAQPNFEMQAVGLAFDPNSGGFSGVTSTRTDLAFVGNGTVAVAQNGHTKRENGLFTSAASAGLGLNSAPVGQQLRVNIPTGGPDREWETFWTPAGDAFFGIDDTPGADVAEIVLGIRPAVSGSFVDDDRTLIVLELDPQPSRATTQHLQLKPRVGSLLTGELFTSKRVAAFELLPGQSFVATTATNIGPGQARVPLIGQIPVLNFLFSERDAAVGQEDLTLVVTPRLIHSLDY